VNKKYTLQLDLTTSGLLLTLFDTTTGAAGPGTIVHRQAPPLNSPAALSGSDSRYEAGSP
jgi:hypothetical protein